MNARKSTARSKRIAERTLKLRNELWPDLKSNDVWDRKTNTGFTTIPRTLPLLFRLMDEAAPKGKPVSNTYFPLWCRAFDEALVTVNSEHEIAFEAGFSGQRATSTLATRLSILEDLGFIRIMEGAKGPRNYILLVNPYKVAKKLYAKKQVQKQLYVALLNRTHEIGATDLD